MTKWNMHIPQGLILFESVTHCGVCSTFFLVDWLLLLWDCWKLSYTQCDPRLGFLGDHPSSGGRQGSFYWDDLVCRPVNDVKVALACGNGDWRTSGSRPQQCFNGDGRMEMRWATVGLERWKSMLIWPRQLGSSAHGTRLAMLSIEKHSNL